MPVETGPSNHRRQPDSGRLPPEQEHARIRGCGTPPQDSGPPSEGDRPREQPERKGPGLNTAPADHRFMKGRY